jgi:23S rRNA (cytosine1962-C5)-methyltransferase
MVNEIKLTLPGIAEGEDKSSPLGNRIRKSYRHLRKWAKRTHTDAFRLYDREIPQYPLVIDFYAGRFCIHYFAPSRNQTEPSPELVDETNKTLGSLFGLEPDSIYWRTRMKSKKTRQYEKEDASEEFFYVYEYGVKFKVNLRDYLDTGLFLDHRETRRIVASLSKGKRVLNLYAYTCSFSVQAAMAGAAYTKSVDMSNTYTAWGKDNFHINSLSLKNHDIIRDDCFKFLDEEIWLGTKYDIIIIDPPTISRSKKMSKMFDIQEDYGLLISKALKLRVKDGVIFFSTNSRRFSFDETLFKSCKIQEISDKTLPLDFHDKKIHRCWKIS